MFENIFTTKQEKLDEAVAEKIRTNFENKEKTVIKEGTDFSEKLEPEKFKNKAANWLLALSLFAGASTAFAGEQNNDKDLPEMGEEQIAQVREKSETRNQTADFDWKKIVRKIEISMGAKSEDVSKFSAESILTPGYINPGVSIPLEQSEFYKGVSSGELLNAQILNYYAISGSQNAEEFFKSIPILEQKGSGEFTDKQKARALQELGSILDETYNYDMLKSGTHVTVSDDKMFAALKEQYFYGTKPQSGICGNIHTFLTKTAQSFGVEAWLQSGATIGGNHTWTGMILGNGEERQIVFLDYETLVPTGTMNYKDALGVMERNHSAISLFNNFAANETNVLVQVKSRANEVVEEAAGIRGAINILGDNFEKGEIEREGRGIEVRINPEIKEIKLNSDSLGLAFFKFENSSNNPYQSLEDLSAWRGSGRLGNEKLKIEGDATVLNMSIKNLYSGTTSTAEAIGRLTASYLDKKQLTKGEYGEILLNFGTTFENVIKVSLGESKGKKEKKRDLAIGGGLIYLDPNNVGKFYIRAEEAFGDKEIGNLQDMKSMVTQVAENFVVGGEVKVFEGEILNMEIGKSNLAWGDTLNIKGGVEGETFKGTVGYEKKTSGYERFIPSSEKIEFGVTYKGGPKWEVDVIGAKTTEKYKDAQSQDIVSGEVKLKVFLW